MPSRAGGTPEAPARFEAGASAPRDAYLLIRHIGGTLLKELAAVLAPTGITPEQYHILRILRDGGPPGLPCSAVATRAVSGDPDVTRLLDRLEGRQLAMRSRDTADRRVVIARITKEGTRLLAKADAIVTDLHARQFSGLQRKEVDALFRLLERIRPGATG